jgi:hypothetical protein
MASNRSIIQFFHTVKAACREKNEESTEQEAENLYLCHFINDMKIVNIWKIKSF